MASVFKRNNQGNWIISYFGHNGKRREKSSGTTDKATAKRIAAKLGADVALRVEGVVDARQDDIRQQAERPLSQHLADFEVKMTAAGRSVKHIRETITEIRTMADFAGWSSIADISAEDANRFAGDLRTKGRSARRIAAYLTAAKSFTRWLTNHHRLASDPLVGVSKPNPRADRRHERRMLLREEWDWLRHATARGEERYGMSGHERMLLYATAIQTGLRSNELRSLTRGRLHLGGEHPYITAKAKSTKNHKDAHQHVRRELADELRAHTATKTPGAKIFAMPCASDVAEMLRADLADARRAWIQSTKHDPDEYERRTQSDFLCDVNGEGEKLDFHSLRHTCGAWLAISGAHPKTVQSVMRHSTITLTMDTYGHLLPGQEADAIAAMLTDSGDPCGRQEPLTLSPNTPSKNPSRFPSSWGAIRRKAMRAGAMKAATWPVAWRK